jgi:hypothetical protein
MIDGAKLIAHRGAEIVTREQLANYPVPEATETWKPVSHLELVETLTRVMADRGLHITREQFAVQGSKLFGTFDTEWQRMEDYTAAIGFRQGLAKDMSIGVACGARVTVCDNLLFSGEVVTLRKHTIRLDLAEELDRAMYRYMQGFRKLMYDISVQKDTEIEERRAKTLIYDIFRNKIVPLRLFPFVVNTYETATKDQKGTGWMLHNAISEHIKKLAPAPAFRATIRLGKFFASKF